MIDLWTFESGRGLVERMLTACPQTPQSGTRRGQHRDSYYCIHTCCIFAGNGYTASRRNLNLNKLVFTACPTATTNYLYSLPKQPWAGIRVNTNDFYNMFMSEPHNSCSRWRQAQRPSQPTPLTLTTSLLELMCPRGATWVTLGPAVTDYMNYTVPTWTRCTNRLCFRVYPLRVVWEDCTNNLLLPLGWLQQRLVSRGGITIPCKYTTRVDTIIWITMLASPSPWLRCLRTSC